MCSGCCPSQRLVTGGSSLYPLFTEVPGRRDIRARTLSLLSRNVECYAQQMEY
jgi:hypothetical protein